MGDERRRVEPAGHQQAIDLALLGEAARVGRDEPPLGAEEGVEVEGGLVPFLRRRVVVGEEDGGAARPAEGERRGERRRSPRGVEDGIGADPADPAGPAG